MKNIKINKNAESLGAVTHTHTHTQAPYRMDGIYLLDERESYTLEKISIALFNNLT